MVTRSKAACQGDLEVMKSKATSVAQYLAELPVDRREAIEAVRKILRENLDKTFEEGMQYGVIGYYVPHHVYPAGYHCDPKQPLPFACLASQKNYMSLYLGCVYGAAEAKRFQTAWAKTGKKLDMGKCCIRFRKLTDLALEVIAETLRGVSAKKFIEFYDSAMMNSRQRPTTSRQTKPRTKLTADQPERSKARGKK